MLINYKDIKEKYKNSSYDYVYIFKIYNLKNELMNIKYLLKIYNEEFILDENDYLELKNNNKIHNCNLFIILKINGEYIIFQVYNYLGKYKTNIANGILKENIPHFIDTFLTNDYIEFIADKFKLSIKEYNKYKVQLQQLMDSQILLFNL